MGIFAELADNGLSGCRAVVVTKHCDGEYNTEMKFNEDRTALVNKGKTPILIEPVRARITIKRSGNPKVYLLDHDGRRTKKMLPVQDGRFEIDGGRDQTMYYEVVYR